MASVYKRKNAGRNGKWEFKYRDAEGRQRARIGFTDKEATRRLANKMEADARLRREGVIDAQLDATSKESARSVEDHLAAYEAKFKAGNRTPKHIRTSMGYIRAIAEYSGWSSVGDITADAVNSYAGELKDAGRSTRTVGAYLTAIKGFTRWLTAHHKLTRDPLTGLSKPNPRADRRRERRMLLPEEWEWLRSTVMGSEPQRGMTGQERVLLYATAIQTGLRSGELRGLTRGRLFLSADDPYITCKAGSTKNRKDARQYIRPELAEELRAYVVTKAPKAKVFPMPPETDVADMLRADLAATRQAWLQAVRHDIDAFEKRHQSDFLCDVNHEGEHLDFHSLRHTCGSWLAMANAHPKAIQSVMRHSTITLTMDTYGHLFPGQEAETVARFPVMLGSDPHTMRATGTTGDRSESITPYTHHAGGIQGLGLSLSGSAKMVANFAANQGGAGDCEVLPEGNGNAFWRTRTSNPLIKSQRVDSPKSIQSSGLGDSVSEDTPHTHHPMQETGDITPELARLIKAWPTLPQAVRVGIVAMIDTATEGGA